ncbi:MAG: hypothetical protein K9J13_07655 [Saprospiraceae bacterium]|nr:hypothetical protein [Saprospiraceae bacterium]
MSKISMFTDDGLVCSLLKLSQGININAISNGLKNLNATEHHYYKKDWKELDRFVSAA